MYSPADPSDVSVPKTLAEHLVCDELGYLALDQQTSNLFYQVISIHHCHKRYTVINTNTPASDWGNILFNILWADGFLRSLARLAGREGRWDRPSGQEETTWDIRGCLRTRQRRSDCS
jgi:IstB-like ATP binding protein